MDLLFLNKMKFFDNKLFFIKKIKKANALMQGMDGVEEDPDPLPEPEPADDDDDANALDLDDDDYQYDPEEDMIYDSPLEKPEAAIYFKETMEKIQESDAELG